MQRILFNQQFHKRPAVSVENDSIRVTVLERGGHIAELLDKESGISPLWIPPWTDEDSIDFGRNSESLLLDGIMGHNLCLDLFGPPSEAEQAAGITAHGEAVIRLHHFEERQGALLGRCVLPESQLAFERSLRVEGRQVFIRESVENQSAFDRPIAWTQHVTLGPPFLERGGTEFRIPAAKSRAIGEATDFDWPGPRNLEVYTNEESSAGYTAHLMNPLEARAWFVAWSPASKIAAGYVWKRSDFPWLGIWEENHSRTHAPWNGRTMTQGMEFGVSPFPETRREMIERGILFDTPCYRWIQARSTLAVEYYAAIVPAPANPKTLAEFESLLTARK